MRRILALLLLVIFCVAIARSQDDPRESPESGDPKAEVVKALESLSATAVEQLPKQPTNGNARLLNEQIDTRMRRLFPNKEDFSNESKWKEVDRDLTDWNRNAHDLKVPQGKLVTAIDKAFNAYDKYKRIAEGRRKDARSEQEQRNPPASLSSLGNDIANLRKDLDSQASVVPPWLTLGLLAASPLLTIGLFALVFIALRQTRHRQDDVNISARQSIVSLKGKQDALAVKLESLTVVDSELAAHLAELNGEISAVGSRVRGLRASPIPAGSASDGATASGSEPPAFPVSADAYLRKMQRHSSVVKPDFQNGILVVDMEKKGELVLVEDLIVSREASLIIPRFTQFQMKQDFYTYYERYYECERPASGTVWILAPAMVERVQDGWSLLQKGVLEVR